ncbi:MAG: serine/threonine protein kinase [Phycisphaeraceae bacterium]|nr:MAG: serine/threonine protein kinase [Phycisphaeraceae bacterium]
MSQADDHKVREIVARFMESRRAGSGASLDDVILSTPGVSDPRSARDAALHALTSCADLSDLAELAGEGGPPPEEEFPELDGYDIVDWIGQGGMGQVYEAYQRSTGRRVAIKFMLPGAASTESARRRFEREVELIARLEHPNIVSILDSGVSNGRAYYAMEYVEGRPLDLALIPGECNPREAMAMIAVIAEAVDYAHQRGVLHRDLKPSNIMVDARGDPRLFDFGLAKAIESGADAPMEMTLSQPGQLLGTLGYMPPEQARGELRQTSVRSDVYSLGAIGYELITGRLPCPVSGPLSQTLTRIESLDAPRPSSLRSQVDHDIDAILLKALEKSSERRYATAGELAADIRRYLAHQPITARRIGRATRAARWVRRNQAVSAVGAAAILTVITVFSVAFLRVKQERDSTQEVAASLADVLQRIDPEKQSTRTETIAEIVDGFTVSIDRLRRQPEFQSRLRSMVGLAYRGLGDYQKAEAQFRAALESQRRLRGAGHPDVAEAHHNLASALYWLGDYDEAERHYMQARSVLSEAFRRGDHAQGPQLARTLDHLSTTLGKLDRLEQAEAISREALELRLELLGETHIDVAQSLNNMARILNERGKHAEAAEACEQALSILRSMGGAARRGEASLLHHHAHAMFGLGHAEEAKRMLGEAIDILSELWSEDHERVAVSLLLLAEVKLSTERLQEAERFAGRALTIWRSSFTGAHPDIASALTLLGTIRLRAGDAAGAEPLLREAAAMCSEIWIDQGAWRIARAQSALGECLAQMSHYDEAETLLRGALDTFRQTRGDSDPATALTINRLADLYEATGRGDMAMQLRIELESLAERL